MNPAAGDTPAGRPDFSLQPGEPVADEIHRVMAEQFGVAIGHLADPQRAGPAEAVHEARKGCKRLRAVFRLVRGSWPERRYRSLDAAVRDAAREISATRDAQALVVMFDDLLQARGLAHDDADLAGVRAGLSDRSGSSEAGDGRGEPLVRAQERLELARSGAAQARLVGKGFEVLRDGLSDTYRHGRSALRRLQASGSAEDSHDWRKAVKYTWHHVELLGQTAPSLLDPTGQRFHDLSDALGDAHNLAVLVDLLEAAPARYGGAPTAERAARLAEASRRDLERRAIRLGLRLYAETPKAFGRRLGAYWKAQRRSGSELTTGELAALRDEAGAG